MELRDADPLLKDAALLVCNMQRCNISAIQRKFAIGYNRAGRIVDQLEKIGIVGPSTGLYDREVLYLECPDIDKLFEDYLKVNDKDFVGQYNNNEEDVKKNSICFIENVKVGGFNLYISKECISNYILYIEKDVDMYISEIGNTEIGQTRFIESHYLYILKYRIEIQFMNWHEQISRIRGLDKSNFNQTSYGIEIFNEQWYSRALDERYKKSLESISNILPSCLIRQSKLDLDAVFNCNIRNNRPKPIPTSEKKIEVWDNNNVLLLEDAPEEPAKPSRDNYSAKLSFIDKIFVRNKRKKEKVAFDEYEKAYMDYEKALSDWNKEVDRIKESNELKRKEHELERNKALLAYQNSDKEKMDEWDRWNKKCIDSAEESNNEKEYFKKNYLAKDIKTVEEYCFAVVEKSKYDYPFIRDFTIEYKTNSILVIDYRLPDICELPKYKECKYVSNEVRPKEISTTEKNKIYDKLLYDISLRSLYELFRSDYANAINAICFNGWVNTIDKATGNKVNNYVLSIQVSKDEFMKLELANVDSKICFKSLKGISASKLFQLTPIKPIINTNKADKRFIESKNVAESIDNTTNLAAMDWEDFEFLVREIFEKEFSANGGEVKITQASRDGGVDAVAFDPDPIKGGKIVIQAKRYTNTVGVSAVRDLWGTVMNEGAMKGLLVTTSDFGPDSYEFAKDKPISLINGSNLLFLLDKHGIHAKIDIKEAKMKR